MAVLVTRSKHQSFRLYVPFLSFLTNKAKGIWVAPSIMPRNNPGQTFPIIHSALDSP